MLDPRDLELPAVGLVTLVDPETGRTQGGLRPPRSCARSSPRPPPSTAAEVAAALRRAGAAHLVLRTDRDWVADVLRFVLARKRGWTGAAAGSPEHRPDAGEAW